VLDILRSKCTGAWGEAVPRAELRVALDFGTLIEWAHRDRLVVSKGHAWCLLRTGPASGRYLQCGSGGFCARMLNRYDSGMSPKQWGLTMQEHTTHSELDSAAAEMFATGGCR
jgi:hypothetical protein